MYKLHFTNYINCWPTGSNYICNPPVTDTDRDTVFFVEDLYGAAEALEKDGWDLGGSRSALSPDGWVIGDASRDWMSFKKNIDGILENYILTKNFQFFTNFVNATELAKKLNLQKKEDRVTLFSVIVDGKALY